MNIPENLKYTKDHEWISIEGDVATVGITDFAQGELGDIVYVEIEKIGENFSKEQVFGTVEAVKTVSPYFAQEGNPHSLRGWGSFEVLVATFFSPVAQTWAKLYSCKPILNLS